MQLLNQQFQQPLQKLLNYYLVVVHCWMKILLKQPQVSVLVEDIRISFSDLV
jgi:hypothetical protein